jgi:hypothetical protein
VGLKRKATNLFFRVLAKPEPLFSDAASKVRQHSQGQVFIMNSMKGAR